VTQTDADARVVLRRFGLPDALAEPLGNCGGFSGARLWRVRGSGGEFCLKAWPPGGLEPGRHVWIAHLVRHAYDSRLHFVPRLLPAAAGRPHVAFADRLWELASWMPGTADFRADPSPARLRAACTALARLHAAWADFAEPPQRCPAVIRRVIAAGAWIDATYGVAMVSPYAAPDPVAPWAERARDLIDGYVPKIPGLLVPWRGIPLSVQPCLCDIWHDHVLFTGDEVTGLIDFGAVKQDNVAADLARLLGSLVGDDEAGWAMGFDAYAAVRPLSDAEQALARLLDRTGVVLGLATWLRRLFHHGHEYEDRAAVARRMAELVRRVEGWK
jgi:Ser/Thr protein kinase RdoA (MazF antagonist)